MFERNNESDLRIARHEAGHAIALLAYARTIIYATIIPQELTPEQKQHLIGPISKLRDAYRELLSAGNRPPLYAYNVLDDIAPSQGTAPDYLYAKAFNDLAADLQVFRSSNASMRDYSELITEIEEIICKIGEATASGHVASMPARYRKPKLSSFTGKAREVAKQNAVIAYAGLAAEACFEPDPEPYGATVDYIEGRRIVSDLVAFASEENAMQALLSARARALASANIEAIELVASELVKRKNAGQGLSGYELRDLLLSHGITHIIMDENNTIPL